MRSLRPLPVMSAATCAPVLKSRALKSPTRRFHFSSHTRAGSVSIPPTI
jgi:hypothetical protein